jgi:branched-chain amino acid transport system substrate-binding protein
MVRTTLRAAAVVGAVSLVLAGCGGGSQPAAPDAAAPTDTPAAAECEPPQAAAGATPSTSPLQIGSILPETGNLAFLGPPEFAGVEVAVEEINAAGGVLDQPVTHLRGDSGDATTDIVNQTVDRHLAAGVQAIVGAASSGVSKLVIDKITSAGVLQISPANTSDEFTCWQDSGLYFRTAPPDLLQAQALAEVIAGDGNQRVSIMALNDPYGTGLADNLEQNLLSAGIPQDQLQKIIYDPNAASFNAEVDQVAQFNPDGIAVIGFDESKRIITRMAEVQVGPAQKNVYGSDGNMGNALGEGLAPGLLEGMRGTTPLTDLAPDFQDRLLAKDPALVDFNYGAESYDAVMLIALSAEVAKSTAGTDIGSVMNSVTQDGEKCTTYADCIAIIDAGGDVDFDGVTGTLDFVDAGEPGSGSYAVLEFIADNTLAEDPEFVLVGASG